MTVVVAVLVESVAVELVLAEAEEKVVEEMDLCHRKS